MATPSVCVGMAALCFVGCAQSRPSGPSPLDADAALPPELEAPDADAALVPDAAASDAADVGPPDGTGAPDASLMDAPRDVAAPFDAGSPSSALNRVFVSSETLAMDLGGVGPYDAACNRLATRAGLQGADDARFMAWMSDAASTAASRLGPARGFVRMDGQPFADDVLASEVFRGVAFDETGARVPPEEVVATGTDAEGARSANHCRDWTDATQGMTTGRADGGPRAWTSRGSSTCSPRRIYCIENVHSREVVPEREAGRLIYLTNDDFEPGGSVTPAAACEASKPAGAGDIAPLLATGTSAASEVLDPAATYVRPDGVAVGTGAQLAVGEWRTGAWQQGDGTYPSEVRRVWTGSERIDALGDTSCDDWGSDSSDIRGHYGFPASPVNGAFWTLRTRRCASASDLRLYCVETGS